jgi:hypothetical protein
MAGGAHRGVSVKGVKMVSGNEIERVASNLEDRARDEDDLSAAKWLRELHHIMDAARDVVIANSYEQSKAAYEELYHIFRGKKED